MILEGKRAVVTGGGRGIGAAVARALAAEGAAVVVSARTGEQIEAVAAELRGGGARAAAVACDVTREADVDALVREATDFLGGVDVLVNNAGIATSAPLKAVTLEEWNRVFAVNVTGTFLCTRGFLPGMLEGGWGRVVNVASVAGKMGAAYISTYAASKHAVIGFTRSLAVEVAARGVTVNAVCPGYVATDMTVESVARIASKTRLTSEEARRKLDEASPQRRIFEPEEVAQQVLMLCDPRAGGVNGQSIVIDGGAVQA
ncbi:MAG TPA: SDR family NAD(P)-dependent oxidoreductase [Thermoanaerobaculia bacterium]